MKKTKSNKGITLVVLVVTIVILLILAGISISTLTNTEIFSKTKEAKQKAENAQKEQENMIIKYEKELNKYEADVLTSKKMNIVLSKNENTVVKDLYGNIFTVPAGFKVTSDAITVDKGIVIEDATSAPTAGSQFVWIPVGTVYTDIEHTEEKKKTIHLGRYEFDEKTGVQSNYSSDFFEEDKGNKNETLKNWNNTIAKNITKFKESVMINEGYYIGRYEARTEIARKDRSAPITQITEKGIDPIYNFISQIDAAQLSQNMYNSNNFTSDLSNSYAWDTATLFLQTCGNNRTPYSRQIRLNDALMQTGTNTLTDTSKIDKQCNVYDMAGNLIEWTTETSNDPEYSGVLRGGNYLYDFQYTGYRINWNVNGNYIDYGFRPILYF